MNDYIYILKRAFKCGIGVLFFLALVQPFGIGRLNEGRMGYILICSLISFLAVLFSLLLTKAASTSLFASRLPILLILQFSRFCCLCTMVGFVKGDGICSSMKTGISHYITCGLCV